LSRCIKQKHEAAPTALPNSWVQSKQKIKIRNNCCIIWCTKRFLSVWVEVEDTRETHMNSSSQAKLQTPRLFLACSVCTQYILIFTLSAMESRTERNNNWKCDHALVYINYKLSVFFYIRKNFAFITRDIMFMYFMKNLHKRCSTLMVLELCKTATSRFDGFRIERFFASFFGGKMQFFQLSNSVSLHAVS
jgi:hypothetical protein